MPKAPFFKNISESNILNILSANSLSYIFPLGRLESKNSNHGLVMNLITIFILETDVFPDVLIKITENNGALHFKKKLVDKTSKVEEKGPADNTSQSLASQEQSSSNEGMVT